MTTVRIALANLRYPHTPEDSVARVQRAIAQAGAERADLVCFPECYVPGCRGLGHAPPASDPGFLERAWDSIGAAAAQAGVVVILGTERVVDGGVLATVLVIDRAGRRLGFQDKVQIDPSEEGTYLPATTGRRVFEAAGMTFGIAICHEGWRYPETVRWAARHGARVVFHPHFHQAAPGSFAPSTFGDPANTFHENAQLCRAAENTCYFASVNYASAGSPTTSMVARPDGTLLGYQPYNEEGLFLAELDLEPASWRAATATSEREPTHRRGDPADLDDAGRTCTMRDQAPRSQADSRSRTVPNPASGNARAERQGPWLRRAHVCAVAPGADRGRSPVQ
jgi:predicted amidohydrolase